MLAPQPGSHRPEQHERRLLARDLRPQVCLYGADRPQVSDRADAHTAEHPGALLAEVGQEGDVGCIGKGHATSLQLDTNMRFANRT